MLWAVHSAGSCLRFASQRLRADPDLCLEAVRQNWEAIEPRGKAKKNFLGPFHSTSFNILIENNIIYNII